MERCRWAVPVASLTATATATASVSGLRVQFSSFVILSVISILLSSQLSGISALPTDPTIRGNVNSVNRSLGAATGDEKVGPSSTIARHHHDHQRFDERIEPSSYFKSALLRRQHHYQQQEGGRGRANPRKLSSDFGCLGDPKSCENATGLTPNSTASTCCNTGLCTDTGFDLLNCGSCGNVCSVGWFCCSSK
jgi:hypothetical protein